MLPEEECSDFQKAKESLCKRFHPVNIKELRGLEFHRMVQQGNKLMQQRGLDLQHLGRRAFPSTEGRELDQLLKGCFFQTLRSKWQRKLGGT